MGLRDRVVIRATRKLTRPVFLASLCPNTRVETQLYSFQVQVPTIPIELWSKVVLSFLKTCRNTSQDSSCRSEIDMGSVAIFRLHLFHDPPNNHPAISNYIHSLASLVLPWHLLVKSWVRLHNRCGQSRWTTCLLYFGFQIHCICHEDRTDRWYTTYSILK